MTEDNATALGHDWVTLRDGMKRRLLFVREHALDAPTASLRVLEELEYLVERLSDEEAAKVVEIDGELIGYVVREEPAVDRRYWTDNDLTSGKPPTKEERA